MMISAAAALPARTLSSFLQHVQTLAAKGSTVPPAASLKPLLLLSVAAALPCVLSCLQPPVGMSTEPQACNLVVSVLQRSYVSTETFPCSMRTLSPEELDDGCCYNAGGMGRRLLDTFWAGRSLLSSWEKAVWNRRAMLH